MEEAHQGHLPRLARRHYQGHAVVMWNMPIDKRATGWLDAAFHFRFRELLLHAASREMLWKIYAKIGEAEPPEPSVPPLSSGG